MVLKKRLHLLILIKLAVIANNSSCAQDTDTISFENTSAEIIIDTTNGNLWQIGKPDKAILNNAHSGINAIITDSINFYPVNDSSSFILIVANKYTQTCMTCLEFWHVYDMDSLTDIGIIDASYDGGNSWISLSDTSNDFYFQWYMDFHVSTGNYLPHPVTTTGKADGWIKSKFCWIWYFAVKTDTIIINPDSLSLRFTFISDSINNSREGWMIDDFTIYSEPLENCTGMDEKYGDNNITLFPNPCNYNTTIQTDKNFENATLNIYNSSGQLTMLQQNISGQKIPLHLENLPSGLFYLTMIQDDKIIGREKLMISD